MVDVDALLDLDQVPAPQQAAYGERRQAELHELVARNDARLAFEQSVEIPHDRASCPCIACGCGVPDPTCG